MKFGEMLKELARGKKMRNTSWEKGVYITIVNGNVSAYISPSRTQDSCKFSVWEQETEWEEVKPEPVKEGMKFIRDGEVYVVVKTGDTTSRLVSMKTWESLSYVNVYGQDVDKLCKVNRMEKLV